MRPNSGCQGKVPFTSRRGGGSTPHSGSGGGGGDIPPLIYTDTQISCTGLVKTRMQEIDC